MPHYSSELARICCLLNALCSVVLLFSPSALLAQPVVLDQSSRHEQVLSDCRVLQAVRAMAQEASESKLDAEQTNAASLPQLNVLWRELPGGLVADRERELELLVSMPLSTFGMSQARDGAEIDRLRKSIERRRRLASLLKNALSLYYQLTDITLAMSRHKQVIQAWTRTIDLLERLPKHGPERNLLLVTLSLEQDRLEQDAESLALRRIIVRRKLNALLDEDLVILPNARLYTSTLKARGGGEAPELRPARMNGPQIWKSALAGIQLQAGVTAVWAAPHRGRLGYYLGVSYTPVARGAFRTLRAQTSEHRREQQATLREYESRRNDLEREHQRLLNSQQRLVRVQRVSQASRAKDYSKLNEVPSQLNLSYLMNRVDLIRKVFRRDSMEFRTLRRARFQELDFIESHAAVAGLGAIECVGDRAEVMSEMTPIVSFRSAADDRLEMLSARSMLRQ